MIKGQDPSRIRLGNSLSDDQFTGQRFDYMLANPPFGVDWKRTEKQLKDERDQLGQRGRFGAGLPRVSDGSLLFLQHLISKMKPAEDGGSRIAIVFSGSPLFSGGAGSGESEIRRWIIENDWLEAIVALPDQLFYNTGISTYFWVVTNRKADHRKGKIVLLDARAEWSKMRKGLGEKRKYVSDERIADITRLYQEALESIGDARIKVFNNSDFGYQRIVVERPQYDETGQPVRNRKGLVADPNLRDNENVPLAEDIDDYLKREVLPHVPDAWVDTAKTKTGFEIPFTRHFYRYEPPRSVHSVDADIARVEEQIQKVLREVRA
jgi:type I restriction enzyme M protein